MTLEEKYDILKEFVTKLASRHKPGFNFEKDHYSWGNVDDSKEYGAECEEQYTANLAVEVLKSIE